MVAANGRAKFCRTILTLVLALAGILLLAGCNDSHSRLAPETISSRGGDNQFVALNSECPKELMVEVMSPFVRGLLGGKGLRHPVPGAKIRFTPLGSPPGLEIVGPSEVTTDVAGHARVRVRMRDRFGDHYCLAQIADMPELQTVFKVTGGVQVKGDKQETVAGRKLPQPVTLTVSDPENRPIAGVPVYFGLVSGPGKNAKLSTDKAVTNADGMVAVQLATDPAGTGKYSIMAEVADPERGIGVRGIRITAMSMDRVGLLVSVLGGLGIFILGMNFMSSGLQGVAGDRLKTIIQFFTQNRFTAIIAGTVVTGLIQSSSACTVMVVGLVNAGLLGLKQAIGLVFGANIGTTVTGQMISFKLDGLALPAVTIGVIMYLACKPTGRKIGQTIFGFGLLFLGMQMMSSELKSVADMPSFANFFRSFDCTPAADGTMPLKAVLGAVFIGTAMTVVVQSSSATIGLTIALASSGLINFYTAVPLILGDNIGTTITAILASIGTNRTARQTAVAHTLFNLIGAGYMVALMFVKYNGVPVFLYFVDAVTTGEVFAEDPENIGRHVAAAHTLFNVFNVILFTPLLPLIAKTCEFLIPNAQEAPPRTPRIQALEKHLLDTPAVALVQTVSALKSMTESAWLLAADSYKAMLEMNRDGREDFAARERRINDMQHQISQYLVELTGRQLLEAQAETVPVLLHCVNDAERIGDHAENLTELQEEMTRRKTEFSKKARRDMNQLFEHISLMANDVVDILAGRGGEQAVAHALKMEGEINRLTADSYNNHIKRLEKGQCSVTAGIIFVEVIQNLERIGDHFSNIAERVPQFQQYILTVSK